MEIILPQWGSPLPMIGALSTTRACGFSAAPYDDAQGGGGLNLGMHVGDAAENVQRNRAQLRRHLPSEPVWLNQVHGTQVVDAATVTEPTEADASFTTQPGIVCAIMTADCLPVLFADKAGKVVGAAHAGWRGLLAGVLENTIAQMRTAGAVDIVAWLGPAIGPAHFEVGEEVREAFVDRALAHLEAFTPIAARPGKYLADLYRLATHALHAAKVTEVRGGRFCTVAEPQRFYSYRRDGTTGRMASLIWLR
jgi:YfiH family protein